MKLTKQQFEAGRSDAGGYNLAQLKAIGVPMPDCGWPKAGWPARLIGSEVSDAQYQHFLALRGNKRQRAAKETVPDLFENVPQQTQVAGGKNGRPLLIPTRYALPWTRIKNAPEWMKAEVVARSYGSDGQPTSWVIHELGSVLSKDDNDWECEPQPSSRDAAFIARTRFDSAEEAARFARKHFECSAEMTANAVYEQANRDLS